MRLHICHTIQTYFLPFQSKEIKRQYGIWVLEKIYYEIRHLLYILPMSHVWRMCHTLATPGLKYPANTLGVPFPKSLNFKIFLFCLFALRPAAFAPALWGVIYANDLTPSRNIISWIRFEKLSDAFKWLGVSLINLQSKHF